MKIKLNLVWQLITKHSDLKWDKTIKKFYIILNNIYHQNNEISLHQKKKKKYLNLRLLKPNKKRTKNMNSPLPLSPISFSLFTCLPVSCAAYLLCRCHTASHNSSGNSIVLREWNFALHVRTCCNMKCVFLLDSSVEIALMYALYQRRWR